MPIRMLGPGFEYSFDGGSFTSVATFAKLAPGTSHTVKVKDVSTGCVVCGNDQND